MSVPKVTWSPDLGGGARVSGAGVEGVWWRRGRGEPGTSVGAEWAWKVVTEETKGAYNFFKVVVEMP